MLKHNIGWVLLGSLLFTGFFLSRLLQTADAPTESTQASPMKREIIDFMSQPIPINLTGQLGFMRKVSKPYPSSCLGYWQQFLNISLADLQKKIRESGGIDHDPSCETWEKQALKARFPACGKVDEQCLHRLGYYRSVIIDRLYPDTVAIESLPDSVILNKLISRVFVWNFNQSRYVISLAEEINQRQPDLLWPYEIRYWFTERAHDTSDRELEEITDIVERFPQDLLSISKLDMERRLALQTQNRDRLIQFLEDLIAVEPEPWKKNLYLSEWLWEQGRLTEARALMQKLSVERDHPSFGEILELMKFQDSRIIPFSISIKLDVPLS